jgi:hypothetical protein
MALTYSQMVAVKNRIETQLEQHENNLDAAVANISSIQVALEAMPANYAGFSAEVTAFATANPTNQAALLLRSQVNLLAAEFTSKAQRAAALANAVEGL